MFLRLSMGSFGKMRGGEGLRVAYCTKLAGAEVNLIRNIVSLYGNVFLTRRLKKMYEILSYNFYKKVLIYYNYALLTLKALSVSTPPPPKVP